MATRPCSIIRVATWIGTVPPKQAIKRSWLNVAADRVAKDLVAATPVAAGSLPEDSPFPDILRPEQKVALCATNKIGRLLLGVRNAHFRLSTSRICFSQIVLRSAYSWTSSLFRLTSCIVTIKYLMDCNNVPIVFQRRDASPMINICKTNTLERTCGLSWRYNKYCFISHGHIHVQSSN